MSPPSDPGPLAQSALDAVSAHVAVVAPGGAIVAVNEAWTAFARRCGAPPGASLGVGANYLEVCRAAERQGVATAGQARRGLESVLAGRAQQFALEYECSVDEAEHWFTMRVSRLGADEGAVVVHEDVTVRRQAEAAMRRAHEALQAAGHARGEEHGHPGERMQLAARAFDSAAEAIVIADAEGRIVTVNPAFTRITGFEAAEAVGRDMQLFSAGREGEGPDKAPWRSLPVRGQWQGEVWNQRKGGEVFPAWQSLSVTRDGQGRVREHVVLFSDISAVKQAEGRLAHLAYHDLLTGLANRLFFNARLAQAIDRARRHGTRVGLVFIDMDNFKRVNDRLGHVAGDQYLQAMAARLAASVRAEDTVARLGGDEFAVLTEDLATSEDAERLAEKLLEVLSQDVCVGDDEVPSSASIGVGLYPDHAASGEELLKAADTAMYQAKADGRHAIRSFRRGNGAGGAGGAGEAQRAALEAALRRAVAGGELALHYQPVVALEGGRCTAVEALLRWQSPEHGLLLPDVFLPLAEQTRLIEPIGLWVIQRALADLERWEADGVGGLRVAVNVSWRQFNDERFVGHVLGALATAARQGPALRLDVEIAEDALRDGSRTLPDLRRLREAGVRVFVDAFGTGHASLGRLVHWPVDGLKIDRALLRGAERDRESLALVRAVIALARGLGLDVVAQGVETESQAALLRRERCALAQGLFFGPPVPAAELPALALSVPALLRALPQVPAHAWAAPAAPGERAAP